VEASERLVVGVNAFKEDVDPAVPILRIGFETERSQVEKVRALRDRRGGLAVQNRLQDLKTAAKGTDNLMPVLLDCVRAYATEGEIMAALKEVFGVYREPILL